MFKIKTYSLFEDILTNEVKSVEKEYTITNSEFYNNVNDDRSMYNNREYLISYSLLDTYTPPPKKVERVFNKESLKEWANSKKAVKCRLSQCNRIGWHSGNFCGIHFVKLTKLLKEKGMSWKRFEEIQKEKALKNKN